MAVVILIQLEETGVVVDISCGVLQHRAFEWDGLGWNGMGWDGKGWDGM